jgi:hypothetical protein
MAGDPLELDDNFKQLVQELGEAINESLAESGKISDVLARIRASGYELLLVLEVTVGFNKSGSRRPAGSQEPAAEPGRSQLFELTSNDARFLRALKITVEGEKS